jgi:hypothetical protein
MLNRQAGSHRPNTSRNHRGPPLRLMRRLSGEWEMALTERNDQGMLGGVVLITDRRYPPRPPQRSAGCQGHKATHCV